MSVVEQLENKFLDRCRTEQLHLKEKYPELRFSVWSSSIGSRTQYQGHSLGLECLFPLASPAQADCVSITIGVMHLTTEPKLCETCVEWGAEESPDISVEFIGRPVPFNDSALNEVAKKFPRLINVFVKAIEYWGRETGSFKYE